MCLDCYPETDTRRCAPKKLKESGVLCMRAPQSFMFMENEESIKYVYAFQSCSALVHCYCVLRICVQSGCFSAMEISLMFLENSHASVMQPRNVFKQNSLHNVTLS